MNLMEIAGRIRRCESELAALATLEFALIEARSDERATIVAIAAEKVWAMKSEDPFVECVAWICDDRAREVAALGDKRRAILAPEESQGLTETKMRTLDEHKINPGNDTLTITVLDEPGHGGANHAYDIEGGEAVPTHLRFQNGPISADGNGVNGITHEALLAVLCDRLRGFQKGPYACKANACALTHLEEAQHWLQQRTIERMRRGVEGTHAV